MGKRAARLHWLLKRKFYFAISAAALLFTVFAYQNCNDVKFAERIDLHSTGEQCQNQTINFPVCNQCPLGFEFNGTTCIPLFCMPGSTITADCPTIEFGTSVKTCNPQGSAYGSCVSSCNGGYMSSGTQPDITCTLAPCANGSINPPLCNQCPAGQYNNGTSCVPQVCTPNTTSATGCPTIANGSSLKTCATDGSGYGSCSSTCNGGYIANGTQPNITCNLPGCTNGAINYPTCNACAAGQYFNGTNCVAQVCTPNTVTPTGCPTIPNGSSLKTCNAQGSAYGSCSSSCNSGYNPSGTQPNISCTINPCPNGATNPPACNQCSAGQFFNGTSCVAQVCSPNSTTSTGCPVINNGSSIKTCNAQGSAYGSCSSSCNSGYTPSGTQPNISCTINSCANGAINPPTCNTCATGYYYNGTSCVAQVCAPFSHSSTGCPVIANGFSDKVCNAQGSAYGSCSSTCIVGYNASGTQPNITCTITPCSNGANNPPACNTCAAGQYFNGTSCVAQVCTPNSTTFAGCPAISNGSSIKTCNAQGSGYGSCTSSCNSGFNASGSQPNISCCVSDWGAGCNLPKQRYLGMEWDGAGCHNYASNCEFPPNQPYTGVPIALYGPIPDVPVQCGPCLGQGICWQYHCQVWDKDYPQGTVSCGGGCN